MKLLVVYATTEGHTRNVAEFIAEVAAAQNHSADVCDSAMPIRLTKASYDAVILGGSVHQGQHQMSLRNFIFEHLDVLSELPCAFFSVSLSAAINEEIYQQEAQLMSAGNRSRRPALQAHSSIANTIILSSWS
jgi:menaquinone-dependent protoporphyrinogen oxidase